MSGDKRSSYSYVVKLVHNKYETFITITKVLFLSDYGEAKSKDT